MGFKKTPLTPKEKKKRAEELLNMADKEDFAEEKRSVKALAPISEGKPIKFSLRVSGQVMSELREISRLSGISINAFCVDVLRPKIKQKLRELRALEEEEY